jgi:Holliday junction DNA helicase RuvA
VTPFPEAMRPSSPNAPGIGKKTAERVCIELKDKVGLATDASSSPIPSSIPVPTDNSTAYGDAVQALMTLGYKMEAADKAVRKASETLGSGATADALIKAALKSS